MFSKQEEVLFLFFHGVLKIRAFIVMYVINEDTSMRECKKIE